MKKEKKTCNHTMHNDKACGRELYDNEHCISHSEDYEGKKSLFNDAFRKEFERQKKCEKEYDFSGFLFPDKIQFASGTFDKDIYFQRSVFLKYVNFRDARFLELASFTRWALWSLFFAVFFAILYMIIGPDSFMSNPGKYTWFSFFYYSIVTFTTLGLGDINPIKWLTEIIVTVEVILGYLMLGGLISILANKLARRS
jgi:hypothetical protein